MSEHDDDSRRIGEEETPTPVPALTPTDLAVVLSHYELGVIEAIEPIERGSRRSPKFLIRSQKGLFVVKRRLERRDDMERVAFCHTVQDALARSEYPTPPLVRTSRHHGTIVVHGDRLYELMGYVHGTRYDGSAEQTVSAGGALARLHDLLKDFESAVEAPRWAGKGEHVKAQLHTIAERSVSEARVVAEDLLGAYERAEERLRALGVEGWAEQVIHGDWHPGNMLFSGTEVAGVTDYDASRLAARVVDFANGAMQFSITREEGHPRTWPDSLDETRFGAFARGYHEVSREGLGEGERGVVAWLMIEAMVAESVGPIATTGRFAAIEGGAFLEMVGRKVSWIEGAAERLEQMAGGGERGETTP